jgi:large subunit ribosomal protein L25
MVETKKISLKAKTRSITGKKVKSLRSNGLIPAILYGHGTKPQSLEINSSEFKKTYEDAGTSTLVDLKINDSNSVKVLTHEPQLNPVTGFPVHVDFYKVKMDEKIKTEIPLEFIGESDAVNNEDGTLITNRDNIEIECLPNNLIPNYEIDLSVLRTFDDQITVSDIKLPQTIEIITDSDEVIAFVEPPRSDEELAELEETSAAEEEKEAIEQIAGEEAVEGEEGASESEETAPVETNKE